MATGSNTLTSYYAKRIEDQGIGESTALASLDNARVKILSNTASTYDAIWNAVSTGGKWASIIGPDNKFIQFYTDDAESNPSTINMVTLDPGVTMVVDGSIYSGISGTTKASTVHARGAAGDIYLYSNDYTNSTTRGIYGFNHDGTGAGILTVNQSNQISGIMDINTDTKIIGSHQLLITGVSTYTTTYGSQLEVRLNSEGVTWPIAIKNLYNTNANGWASGIKLALGSEAETGKWAGISAYAGTNYANNVYLDLYAVGDRRFTITNNSLYPAGRTYTLGSTSKPFNHLFIGGATNATMTADSYNPRITFQEVTNDNPDGTQPVHLIYTDQNTYRSPAGLKVIGGTSATPAWFEVEGSLYAGTNIYADDGNVYAGTTSSTGERSVQARSGAGTLYIYAQDTATGSRGIYGVNAAGTAGSILTINQSNQISNLARIVAQNVYIGTSDSTANEYLNLYSAAGRLYLWVSGDATNKVGASMQNAAGDFKTIFEVNQNRVASWYGSAQTLATTRKLWGQDFNGSADVTGTITIDKSKYGPNSIELYGNAAPFIDFHYNNSGDDYSVRIINNSSAGLNFVGSNFTFNTDSVRIQPNRSTTANVTGWGVIILGNSVANSSTTAHSEGRIQIYSASTGYHYIEVKSTTSSFTHYLPNVTGIVAQKGNDTNAVGSASLPVYAAADGTITTCGTTMFRKHMFSKAYTVAANSAVTVAIDYTLNGYTPVALYNISSGNNSVVPRTCALDQIILRNVTSASVSSTIYVGVLYVNSSLASTV